MSCHLQQKLACNQPTNNAIIDTRTTGHFGLLTTPWTTVIRIQKKHIRQHAKWIQHPIHAHGIDTIE